MFSMKTIFGDEPKYRTLPNQQTEVQVRSKTPARMTQIGMREFKYV